MSHLIRFLGVLLVVAALYALGWFVATKVFGDISGVWILAIPSALFCLIIAGLFVTLWDITA